MKFSVVVATVNEGAQIASSLKRLRQISDKSRLEIIVVDGGSSDGTADLARAWADQVIVQERPNRGAQLDAGARKSSGELIVFVPPEAQLPGNWQQALEHFWLSAHPRRVAATAFKVDYGAGWSFRAAAALANAAARWRGLAGSAHGLCTTPEIYRESGGFPPLAYGEDLAFCARLRRLGEIVLLKERLRCEARRMRRSGALSCLIEDLWLSWRLRLGASPEELWRSQAGR